jgi:hypothetical protein
MMTQGHLRLHRQNNDEYRKRLMHDNLGILACVLWDVLVLTVFCEVYAELISQFCMGCANRCCEIVRVLLRHLTSPL